MSRFLITVKKNKDGFMLFEAILSVAILSLGLVLILHSFTGSLRAARVSQDYMRAALLLEDKMSRLEIRGSPPAGLSQGEFSQGNEGFTWEIKTTPVEGTSDGEEEEKKAGLNEVRLTVSWSEGKRIQRATLITYLERKEVRE